MICRVVELLLVLLLLSSFTVTSRCKDGRQHTVTIIEDEERESFPLTASESQKLRNLAIVSSAKVRKKWKEEVNRSRQVIAEMKQLEIKLKLYLQHEEHLERMIRIKKAKENGHIIPSFHPQIPGRKSSADNGRKGSNGLHNENDPRSSFTIDDVLSYTWHNPNFGEEEGEMRKTLHLKEYMSHRMKGTKLSDGERLKALRRTILIDHMLNNYQDIRKTVLRSIGVLVGLPVQGIFMVSEGVMISMVTLMKYAFQFLAVNYYAHSSLLEFLSTDEWLEGGWKAALPFLDYRRYPWIRPIYNWYYDTVRKCGDFCHVVWNAHTIAFRAIWPALDMTYTHPEAEMLREALAMIQSSLRSAASTHEADTKRYKQRLALDLGPNRIYASLAETCLQNAPPFKLCMFDVLTISTIHERRRGDDADNNDTCEQRTAEAILMENNHTTANNAGLTEDELRLEWQGWIKKGEVSDSENEEEETTYQDMLYASNTSRGESIALPHDGFTCQNIQAIVRLHCGKNVKIQRVEQTTDQQCHYLFIMTAPNAC